MLGFVVVIVIIVVILGKMLLGESAETNQTEKVIIMDKCPAERNTTIFLLITSKEWARVLVLPSLLQYF